MRACSCMAVRGPGASAFNLFGSVPSFCNRNKLVLWSVQLLVYSSFIFVAVELWQQVAYLFLFQFLAFSIFVFSVSVHVARTTVYVICSFLVQQLKAYLFGFQINSKWQQLLLFFVLFLIVGSLFKNLVQQPFHIKFRYHSLNHFVSLDLQSSCSPFH